MDRQIFFDGMLAEVQIKHGFIQGIRIAPGDLVFEERVKMSCFFCGRYNNNWKCPPYIPDIDYPKMLSEFDDGALIWVDFPFNQDNYEDIRMESSMALHKALLDFEAYLYERQYSLALSFIGGGCKLCKNGCAPDGCRQPYRARSPLEALGVNVIKSAEKYGLDIRFAAPRAAKGSIKRVGLLLW